MKSGAEPRRARGVEANTPLAGCWLSLGNHNIFSVSRLPIFKLMSYKHLI